MSTDMSIIHLITGASFVVQLVMILLALASVLSWTVIFSKWKLLGAAKLNAEAFEDRFWSAHDLSDLYNQTVKNEKVQGSNGLETIFEAGFREFAKL